MQQLSLRKGEILYLLAYAVLLFKISFANTTFVEYVDNKSLLWKSLSILPYSLIICKLFFLKELVVKSAIISSLIFTFSVISFYYTNYTEILNLMILIIGIQNVDFKKIVVTFFCVYGFVMISALCSALAGMTVMYVIDSDIHGIRYGLGNTYPTAFSSGIFYMLLSFVYLFKKWKFVYTVTWWIAIILTFYYTKGRTDFLLSAFVLLGQTILNKNIIMNDYRSSLARSVRFLSHIIFPLFMLVSYFAVILFNAGNSLAIDVNTILNYRIAYISNFLSDYNVGIFGNQIIMTGSGWGTATGEDYNYLDNGYFFSLLMYGAIFTSFIIIGLSYVSFKSKNLSINYIFLFIAINAFIEPSFLSYQYNPFLLLIGSIILNRKQIKSCLIK